MNIWLNNVYRDGQGLVEDGRSVFGVIAMMRTIRAAGREGGSERESKEPRNSRTQYLGQSSKRRVM